MTSEMKKPAKSGLKSCDGEPLQKEPEEFSAWDNLKFTMGGLFVLALPLVFIALVALILWSLFGG